MIVGADSISAPSSISGKNDTGAEMDYAPTDNFLFNLEISISRF